MRPYDIVLFGATGFTGTLVATYLKENANHLKWAIAGRNAQKLEDVKRELGLDVDVRVADGLDVSSLEALVPEARVVCTTAGPFAKYGRALARACARHGTHYCDITGEVPFIRASIDENDDPAKESRARIVHCCGYDSIPFDLGVHMLWDHAGHDLAWAKAFAAETKGGFSGGTVASMLHLMEEAGKDRAMRRLLADPHALDSGRGGKRDPREADQLMPKYDWDLGRWTAPHVMAAINTRVVRRSASLVGYGDRFTYQEAMSFGRGPVGLALAAAVTGALAGFVAVAQVPILRSFLESKVLPKPGEGPSKETRDAGYFTTRLVVRTEDGKQFSGKVHGDSDPGYGETAKMLGQSALCLAEDEGVLPPRYGVLTPASAMGMTLVERLRRAGMTFSVDGVGPVSKQP